MHAQADFSQVASGLGTTDDRTIERMLRGADIACLRAALFQLTGDSHLAALKTGDGVQTSGDRMAPPGIEREEDREQVRQMALAALQRLRNGSLVIPEPPRENEFRALAELFFSESMSDEAVRFWWEEFGAQPMPRAVVLDVRAASLVNEYNVIVIGAGMSGITAGVALKTAGLPFTIIEQNEDIGGTWYRNRYPGARVDVASMAYCNTYEPFFPWKHNFAVQEELQHYFHHHADKHGLWSHIQLGTRVTGLTWDGGEKVWNVAIRNADGASCLRARFVISAIGVFGRVATPRISGLEDFQGEVMHSAEWRGNCDLTGKKIGVIGTGSSGIQLVSDVEKKAKHLAIFQRSPAWLANVPGYQDQISETQRWLTANVPYYRNWLRLASVFGVGDSYGKALDIDPEWKDEHTINAANQRLRNALVAYMKGKIGHRPDLMAKCMPDYPPLAKRLPKDNGWYDAILKDHVELVTTPIVRITERGVLTQDGREFELDALILATGFKATEFLLSIDVHGDGVALKDFWAVDGARAYWGIGIPHFPNLFCMYGPNTNGRAVGPAAWGEMQARYTIKCIRNLLQSGKKALVVKQDRYDEYNRELDRRLEQMIFSVPGQSSYFQNEHGRIATNGAFYNREYFAFSYEPEMNDFHIS